MCNCIYIYFVKLADSGQVIGISEHPLCTSFSRFYEMKLHLMCCIILYCTSLHIQLQQKESCLFIII